MRQRNRWRILGDDSLNPGSQLAAASFVRNGCESTVQVVERWVSIKLRGKIRMGGYHLEIVCAAVSIERQIEFPFGYQVFQRPDADGLNGKPNADRRQLLPDQFSLAPQFG